MSSRSLWLIAAMLGLPGVALAQQTERWRRLAGLVDKLLLEN